MEHKTFSPRAGAEIAYRKTDAVDPLLPGVIFLSGFHSDMSGTKAAFLEEACKKRGQAYLRFDYSGHGFSSGKFIDGTIGLWLQDALDVFDHLTEGPYIVVGSSMGGWLALLLALKRPRRVAGLVGIAAAPDFSEDVLNHELTDAQKAELAKNKILYLPNPYGDPHPLTQNLFIEARSHLLLQDKISITCPVRLVHGQKDADVPWQKSRQIRQLLVSDDVETVWIADGDHRLSRPEDLALIDRAVEELSLQRGVRNSAISA